MPDLFSGTMTGETEKYGDFLKSVCLTPILAFIVCADVVNSEGLTLILSLPESLHRPQAGERDLK